MAAYQKEAAMSWKVISLMSQRIEFVKLAMQQGANISELCRRFGISRKTGYKFINRYQKEGVKGLKNRSNRPEFSPNRTDPYIEHMILQLRDKHPPWGGRKLKRRLEDFGFKNIPAPSTITAILERNGRITIDESKKRIAYKSFCP